MALPKAPYQTESLKGVISGTLWDNCCSRRTCDYLFTFSVGMCSHQGDRDISFGTFDIFFPSGCFKRWCFYLKEEKKKDEQPPKWYFHLFLRHAQLWSGGWNHLISVSFLKLSALFRQHAVCEQQQWGKPSFLQTRVVLKTWEAF